MLLCYKTKLDLVAKGLSLCVVIISETTLLWKATEEVVMGSPLCLTVNRVSLILSKHATQFYKPTDFLWNIVALIPWFLWVCFVLSFWPGGIVYRILVLWPGVRPGCPTVKAPSPGWPGNSQMLVQTTSIRFYCCVTNYHQPERNSKPLQYCYLENPMEKEPGGLQSMGWQRVRYNLATLAATVAYNNSYLLTHSALG